METLTAPAPNKKQGSVALQKIRPDLNLEKWSIWQPSNSRNKKTRVLKREIALDDGTQVTAEVKIGYVDQMGTITTEDQKTCYALFHLWEEKGRPDEQTYFSLRKLSKVLKKHWGTNVILHTSQSLMRLRGVPLILKNAYFDSTKKETLEVLEMFNILSDLKIIKRKVDGHITKEEGYFRFNDFILKNILNGHTKPVLLEVVLSFKSEIAQLLYTHLDLMLAKRTSYERKTRELFFDDLGLEGKAYRNLSNRVQKLKPALDELIGVQLSTGFITSAKLEKTVDGKDYKIVITKSPQQPLAFIAEEIAEHDDQPATLERADQSLSPAPSVTETALPPSRTGREVLAEQARELVNYFHHLFHDATHTSPTSKAINQAIALIAQHGVDLARFIVDFAHREAGKTNYHPQTFGGIIQYTPRAVAEHTKENARRKAQQSTTACTLCDHHGYATFTNEQGSGVVMQCPHDLDTIHMIEAARAWRYVAV
jgi:hypothetical protein